GRRAGAGRAGESDPHRLSRRCAAFFLQGQNRRARRLYGRPLSSGCQESGGGAQPALVERGLCSGSRRDRVDERTQEKADLLCEPTSVTLSRRQLVDFSIPTFLDGASLIVRADGPKKLNELTGRKVGVAAGTTTEESLRNSLKDAGIGAEVVAAKTHGDGLAMLEDGTISA